MDPIFALHPLEFAARLRSLGRRRAAFVFEDDCGAFCPSLPELQPVANRLTAESRGDAAHEAIFLEVGRETGALMGAFLHSTVRGQAQGGLRNQPYATFGEMLRDGLRLSRGMTYKNALAGLWWGGGKGVIAGADAGGRDPGFRRRLYREYGAFVSSLRGCYVTAEDAGTSPRDMAEVFRSTRHVTCVPRECGGSGDPSRMTAAGVVCAMEAALGFIGAGSLAGLKVALQGAGHVGSALIPLLLQRGAREVVASEPCEQRRASLLDVFSGEPVEIHPLGLGDADILAEPCDVLAPCALGGVLGPKTIPSIQAKVVCGPANNQLVDERRDAEALKQRGIVYVPDFVANRMGIVACSNEQYGEVNADPAIERHLDRSWKGGIHRTTEKVLELARRPGVTTVSAATQMAEELARRPHPICGHRARRIVESLVADRWANL